MLNCHQKYTFFAGIWLSGVKKVDEAIAEGVDNCGPVKTIHKGFCIDTL